MKNLSKLLCAVLVIALLCTSLVFVAGAEEEVPAYTSVPADTSAILAVLKLDAADNLISYISSPTNSLNGWNGEGARQAHIVTNTKTGESWYHEWFEGDTFLLKEGLDGNEYIQINFEKQTLTYEEGFHEYMVIDMDLAYTAKAGKIYYKGNVVNTSNMKQEVIGRGPAGTSWSTVQNYKDFGLGEDMKHVTCVYDYTSANAYIFVNGVLAQTYANGALATGAHANYLSGLAVEVSEWRIGSNSADEFHMANAYVRHTRAADAEDTLAAAIASGNISAWNGNIYDEDYVVPTPYWFVSTIAYQDLGYVGNLASGANDALIAKNVEGNLFTGISRANAATAGAALPNNGAYLNTYVADYSDNPYYVFAANQNYNPGYHASDKTNNDKNGDGAADNDNNPFLSLPFANPVDISIASGTKAMYVFELDVASHGTMLDEVTFELELRQGAGGTGGFPFGKPVDVSLASLVDKSTEWSHITVVGDVANNQLHAFVNGNYYGVIGVAYEAGQTGGKDVLCARSARIILCANNTIPTINLGESFAMDNLSHRIYADGNDELAAALASKNISSWSGYTNGRGGELLNAVATVDGVTYYNAQELEYALASNDTLNVEFHCIPFTPVKVSGNAKIDTKGIDAEKLFYLGEGCEITATSGDYVTVTAPFVSNVALGPEIGNKTAWIAAVKGSNKDNQFGAAVVSMYWDGATRTNYVATNLETGEKYILDTTYGKEIAKNANTYIDWQTTDDKNICKYELGANQFIVFDLDFALIDAGSNGNAINLNPITRNASGGGVWGNSAATVNDIFSKAGIGNSEFAHITMALSPDTREMTIFVNGEYVTTVANAIKEVASGHYLNGFRTFSSASATAAYANASIRCVKDASLTAAVNAHDLTTWSNNLYTKNYKLPTLPSIATVDGAPVYSEAEFEAALNGNKETPAVVKINQIFSETITVNCDAVISTYGQDVKFVDAAGNALVAVDGVITFDAPYIANKVVEKVTITGGHANEPIYNAIKYDVSGNLFKNFAAVSKEYGGHLWGTPGYRNASLVTNVETGDVYYLENSILGSDGKMNDYSNEYVNFNFDSVNLKYEAGKNEYLVVDFDFGTETEILDTIGLQVIPRVGGSGAWASDVCLKDLPIELGTMAHVTLVFDYSTNNAHVFINGAYAYTVEEGAMDGEHSGGRTDGSKWADRYMKGEGFTLSELKLGSDHKTSTVCFDNMAIRFFDLAASDDTIGAAVKAGDITTWSGSIYNSNYKTTVMPAIATVDGVAYGSVDTLNAALATETETSKNVEFKHAPEKVVKVLTDAVVETHGLNVELDHNTGLYKFHNSDPWYVCTGTDYSYASNRLVLIHNEGESVYTYVSINENNCNEYASTVLWFNSTENDAEGENVDVVYYVYGDQIKPINDEAYIENGKLIYNQWFALDTGDMSVGAEVESFPVASNALNELWFLLGVGTKDAPFGATDIKQSANVSSNVQFTVYVKKSETVTSGAVTVIDGVEYVTFTFEFAPHQINEQFTVEFYVTDADGRVYLQKQTVSFVDYAAGILADANQSTAVKDLAASILAYSNEAHKLFKGETIAEVDALLASYAAPTVTPGTVFDTADLSEVIRAAAMKLNSAPEFVFKVARGFKGTLTFSYTGVNGAVEVKKTVDATECEQYVVLDGFDVCDITADITITATKDGADTSVTGTYNLSTYAAGLADPAFAHALMAYAATANNYKTGVVTVTVDGEVVGEYIKGSKINVPFFKDGLTTTWYVGTGADKTLLDFDTFVINEDVVLSYEHKITKTDITKDECSQDNLKLIVESKIKQFDGCDVSVSESDKNSYGYFDKEGGKAYYVKAVKNGAEVDALYFSRTVAWSDTITDENPNYAEHRYQLDTSKKVVSVSFDYLILGTVESVPQTEGEVKGEGIFQIKTADDGSYINAIMGNATYIEDGSWHTFKWTAANPEELDCILIKLYRFSGEMVITNLVINYAE